MSGCGHTAEEHEAMKAPGIFERLVFIGYQPGGNGLPDFELRNVVGTECTISRPCQLTEEQREQAHASNRELSLRNRAMVAAARARIAAAAHA